MTSAVSLNPQTQILSPVIILDMNDGSSASSSHTSTQMSAAPYFVCPMVRKQRKNFPEWRRMFNSNVTIACTELYTRPAASAMSLIVPRQWTSINSDEVLSHFRGLDKWQVFLIAPFVQACSSNFEAAIRLETLRTTQWLFVVSLQKYDWCLCTKHQKINAKRWLA